MLMRLCERMHAHIDPKGRKLEGGCGSSEKGMVAQ